MPYEPPFRYELTPEPGGGMRVRAFGDLDMATVPQLDTELKAQSSSGERLLVIDLGGLDFMDSSGLRLLLSWDAYARRDGIRVEVVPGPPAVQRVLDVTGTAPFFTFRPD